MEMGMWDIKSGQGRYALFYLNSWSAVGQLERTCVVDITVDSTLQLLSRVCFFGCARLPP
jgi:hypothetical protein